jgi:hypothetical protein
MTTWLSPSQTSDRTNGAPETNAAVVCAALALLLAIVLFLATSPRPVISVDDVRP